MLDKWFSNIIRQIGSNNDRASISGNAPGDGDTNACQVHQVRALNGCYDALELLFVVLICWKLCQICEVCRVQGLEKAQTSIGTAYIYANIVGLGSFFLLVSHE